MIVRSDVVGGLVFLGLGGALLLSGRELGIGDLREPGSGFLVFWGGVLTCLFSASILLDGVRGGGADIRELWAGTRWPRVVAVVGCLVAYAILLGPLGFLLATVPLLLALLRIGDPVRWRVAVPVAAGATLTAWWVVERLLLIQLPKGTLEIL